MIRVFRARVIKPESLAEYVVYGYRGADKFHLPTIYNTIESRIKRAAKQATASETITNFTEWSHRIVAEDVMRYLEVVEIGTVPKTTESIENLIQSDTERFRYIPVSRVARIPKRPTPGLEWGISGYMGYVAYRTDTKIAISGIYCLSGSPRQQVLEVIKSLLPKAYRVKSTTIQPLMLAEQWRDVDDKMQSLVREFVTHHGLRLQDQPTFVQQVHQQHTAIKTHLLYGVTLKGSDKCMIGCVNLDKVRGECVERALRSHVKLRLNLTGSTPQGHYPEVAEWARDNGTDQIQLHAISVGAPKSIKQNHNRLVKLYTKNNNLIALPYTLRIRTC
jgi:hypothetical protein